jgi:hypothetical protein
MRTLLLAAAAAVTLTGAAVAAPAFTYTPTEQDRHELAQCVIAHGAGAKIADCLLPTTQRIVAEYATERNATTARPPSQLAVMWRQGSLACGVTDENTPATPELRACADALQDAMVRAVVLGLRGFIVNR